MIYKFRSFILLLGVLICIVLSGCSQDDSFSQYNDAAEQFNKIYFETVEALETEDAIKAMEQLQTDSNKKNIDKLGELLIVIKNNIPKNRDKLLYSFSERYEVLVFLRDIYPKISELSLDEKFKIWERFILIRVDIDDWEDKSSHRVWK